MAISKHDQESVDAFFEAIEPFKEAYRQDSFAYLAVKQNETFVLVQGTLFLNVTPSQVSFTHFRSPNIRAGHYALSDLNLNRRELIEGLLSGGIRTPKCDLRFPADQNNRHSAYHAPFSPLALQNQYRMNTLLISGAQQSPFIQQPAFDWELRAAPRPYDTLHELMAEYQLGALSNNAIKVEVSAFNVVAVDRTSKVVGERAELIIRLADGLQTERATVGYRVVSKGQVIERHLITGSELDWKDIGEYHVGSKEINISRAAALQCIASYNGIAQHFWWIADPSTFQNARRAAYETYDRDLGKLREILSREQFRGNDARDF